MKQDRLVVHVVHSLGVGGLENGVVNLVNGNWRGLRHAIICLTTAGPLRARLRSEVEVFVIGKRPGHDLLSVLRLARLLRRLRPRLVHSRNWATFDAVIAARLARVGAVVHGEHGRDITDPNGLDRRRNRIRRMCAPLVDRFVAVSADLRRWLVERVGIATDKVLTIPNGVDTERFAPSECGVPRAADRLVVGTVGRLDPVKDHVELLRAFHRVRARGRDAILLIVGDGPCRRDLEREVIALGLEARVVLVGEGSDVPDMLRGMDVFVLPSIAEGMSNTVLEAMATGLPIVATRVGGNPELIDDGVTGRLVPSRDPDALASALLDYLDDPYLRTIHGKSARERAVETFGLARMRAAYADLYDALGADDGRS